MSMVSSYIKYLFKASNGKGHGIHSPFVYQFIREVLNDSNHYEAYGEIESIRNEMLKDQRELDVKDLGAGQRYYTEKRRVSQIAGNSVKPARFGQLLYRIAKFYNARSVLELGTSLGITTLYLSKAINDGMITTIEGSENIVEVAKQNFARSHAQNIRVISGEFSQKLPEVLGNMNSIDLAFIDGNHRYQPTLNYFRAISAKTHDGSIIILDDIHWSGEMEKAWEEIKREEISRCTIDLFYMGIVFFRSEFREKQDFVVRF